MKIKGNKRYYGEVIGIALLDQEYSEPLLPGDVGNASTYDFPVRLKIIEGLYDNPFPPIRDEKGNYTPDVQKTVNAVKELEADGVRAIVMACGYFSILQDILTEEVEIPVFSSALMLVPLISKMIGKKKKVGIIVASKSSITEEFLSPAGIDDSINYTIEGLDSSQEFNDCIMRGTRTDLDVDLLRKDVIDITKNFVDKNPDIGAILLECTTLPTFSADIQEVTNLPVFDYITFINSIYHAVVQKRYMGII